MEIWMSRSPNAWSCIISIESGATGDVSDFSLFGPELTDKGAVDIWLRRAQTAILNPHLPHETFLNKNAEELRGMIRTDVQMLKFSRKRVRVNIQDPDGANLYFVDLPGHNRLFQLNYWADYLAGLIQNEEQEVIDLVKGLVESNIGKTTCIISSNQR
jgi:hypothetical protein